MILKKISSLLFLGIASLYFSQDTISENTETEKSLYIKGNALFIPIGIINVGAEYQVTQNITMQGDLFISPWKSFSGHELEYYMLGFDGRYYFKEAFKGWYLGANISVSAFKLQKWNYWNDDYYFDEELNQPTNHINSNLYQKGYSVIIGAVGGYQFKIGDRWNMDIYAGVGNSQDFYKGFDRTTGERYDKAVKWNKSGEWIPYKGGIMLSYKIN